MPKLLDVDDLLETPDDPRFIPGVFNYCHRRCERCGFTERCRLFANEQLEAQKCPDDHWTTRVRRSLQRTIALLERWCEREGVSFEELQADGAAEEAAELRALQDARHDPLLKLAEQYTGAALTLADRLHQTAPLDSWSSEAREALDTIVAYALRVSSKTHRALTGRIRRLEPEDADPLQTDWNGSAKVARLDIAESRTAWQTLLHAGRAPSSSPVRKMIDLLDRIDTGIATRFPRAMEFIRPGFDEPQVAAGAVSTKAPFELRRTVDGRAL